MIKDCARKAVFSGCDQFKTRKLFISLKNDDHGVWVGRGTEEGLAQTLCFVKATRTLANTIRVDIFGSQELHQRQQSGECLFKTNCLILGRMASFVESSLAFSHLPSGPPGSVVALETKCHLGENQQPGGRPRDRPGSQRTVITLIACGSLKTHASASSSFDLTQHPP